MYTFNSTWKMSSTQDEICLEEFNQPLIRCQSNAARKDLGPPVVDSPAGRKPLRLASPGQKSEIGDMSSVISFLVLSQIRKLSQR